MGIKFFKRPTIQELYSIFAKKYSSFRKKNPFVKGEELTEKFIEINQEIYDDYSIFNYFLEDFPDFDSFLRQMNRSKNAKNPKKLIKNTGSQANDYSKEFFDKDAWAHQRQIDKELALLGRDDF